MCLFIVSYITRRIQPTACLPGHFKLWTIFVTSAMLSHLYLFVTRTLDFITSYKRNSAETSLKCLISFQKVVANPNSHPDLNSARLHHLLDKEVRVSLRPRVRDNSWHRARDKSSHRVKDSWWHRVRVSSHRVEEDSSVLAVWDRQRFRNKWVHFQLFTMPLIIRTDKQQSKVITIVYFMRKYSRHYNPCPTSPSRNSNLIIWNFAPFLMYDVTEDCFICPEVDFSLRNRTGKYLYAYFIILYFYHRVHKVNSHKLKARKISSKHWSQVKDKVLAKVGWNYCYYQNMVIRRQYYAYTFLYTSLI